MAGSGPRTRKQEGRLSILPTLPLDVLYEVRYGVYIIFQLSYLHLRLVEQIFAHLDPGDLVSLARTTKSFRKVLLSRQAALIWRSALEATAEDGFPPRPHGMSEPAWAGFFFGGPHCSVRSRQLLRFMTCISSLVADLWCENQPGCMLDASETVLQGVRRSSVRLCRSLSITRLDHG